MGKPGKILYLTYDGLTDPLGHSQILPYLTGLADRGFVITIISFEKWQRFTTGKSMVESLVRKHGLEWIPLHYYKSPPVFSTIYGLLKLRKAIAALPGLRQISIVHCRSYVTMITGLWCKRKFGMKLIFDMRGFWADERVEGGIWNIKNPAYKYIYRYFKRKERIFIRESDHIVSLTVNAKNYILKSTQTFKNNLPKISVIPTCVNIDFFNPDLVSAGKKKQLLEILKLNNKQIITYHGSLGTWYLLDEMYQFYKVFKLINPNSCFLIITNDLKIIRNFLTSNAVYYRQLFFDEFKKEYYLTGEPEPGGIIITSSSYEQMPQLLSLSTLGICFIKPVFSKIASSATKIGELLAMGIPVISNKGWGDINFIIQDGLNGWLVENFSEENYLKIINRIQDSPPLIPERIREKAKDDLSLVNGVNIYAEIYREFATVN